MADDTNKPAETRPTTPATSTTAAASPKPPATRTAARPKAAKAATPAATKPAGRRAPATVKAATTTAKKTVTRTVAKKSPPANKVAHEPAPFVARNGKAGKPAKVKPPKPVRDSFTMPAEEYALIATLKKRCLNVGVSAKKSEILRAAVANLAKSSDAAVVAAVRRLDIIKTGRPAKGSK